MGIHYFQLHFKSLYNSSKITLSLMGKKEKDRTLYTVKVELNCNQMKFLSIV